MMPHEVAVALVLPVPEVVLLLLPLGVGVAASCARHLTSSVGVLTTQVANPPTAPAIHVDQRLDPVGDPGGRPNAVLSADSVRL